MEFKDRVKDKRNIVFVGESGCGKTELSINLACALAGDPSFKRKINLLDMDQTKFVFRSRDLAAKFESRGVNLIGGAHFLDAPIVPPGTERLLKDENSFNILDVGGNEIGAVSLGQYEKLLNNDITKFYIVVNPYRLLSTDGAHICTMIEGIKTLGRIENIEIVGNPHMGEATTVESFYEGLSMLKERLAEANLCCSILAIPNWLAAEEEVLRGEYDTILVERFIQYP